jgi:hypothetical protein
MFSSSEVVSCMELSGQSGEWYLPSDIGCCMVKTDEVHQFVHLLLCNKTAINTQNLVECGIT